MPRSSPVTLGRLFGCLFHRFGTCASSLLRRFRFGIKLVFSVMCIHWYGERNCEHGCQDKIPLQVALLDEVCQQV